MKSAEELADGERMDAMDVTRPDENTKSEEVPQSDAESKMEVSSPVVVHNSTFALSDTHDGNTHYQHQEREYQHQHQQEDSPSSPPKSDAAPSIQPSFSPSTSPIFSSESSDDDDGPPIF